MPRAISPVVGAPLLIAVTVVLAAVVGVALLDAPVPSVDRPIVLSVTATADDGRIVLVYERGPPLDVRELTVRIEVDGTLLTHQPPVPFFSAKGFRSGPTGAFNSASDPVFEVGDRTSLRVAGTNSPTLAEGATLTLSLYRDDSRIAVAETRVE